MSECAQLQQALQKLSKQDTDLLAGGTDWYPALQGVLPPSDVIDVKSIESLRQITHDEAGWRIGAAVTWSQLMKADLPAVFDALKLAGREVGSIQIQNSATLVGNLCNASPAADGVPPLLALDAVVELSSLDGSRELPLHEFILGVRKTARRKDELVSAIRIPQWSALSLSQFSKLGTRTYLLISIAMLAVTLELDAAGKILQARIAVGACSAVAMRLYQLESELVGQRISDVSLTGLIKPEHLAALTPIDDVRATAHYRLQAVQEMLLRVIKTLQQQWQKSR